VKQRGRPRIVVDHDRAARVRRRSNGRNIGHFEGLRTGRLDQHRLGVGLKTSAMPAPIRGRSRWSRRRSGQASRCKNFGWPVGVVANQEMIAGLQHRKQVVVIADKLRAQDRRLRIAGPQEPSMPPEEPGGRRSVASILELAAVGVQIVRGRIEHRGTMDDRRIDESLLRLVSRPAVTNVVSAFETPSGRHPLENSCFSAAIEYFCPTATPRKCPLRQRVAGRIVNSRTGKTDVNPLTRPSSRSVMRSNEFVAAC